jgi:hypothetical protein
LRFEKSGSGVQPFPGDLFFAGIARSAFGGITQPLGGGNPHQHRLLVDEFVKLRTGIIVPADSFEQA